MTEQFPDQSKIHETSEDRQRQREILRTFAHRFNLTGEVTQSLERQDARLFRNAKYIAVAEAKFRNNTVDAYADYTIDQEKVDSLRDRSRADGVRGVLVVSWMGDIRYLDITKAFEGWTPEDDLRWHVSKQKRRDRKELADPVYHIPVSEFTKLQ
jgi:hypothetical protein